MQLIALKDLPDGVKAGEAFDVNAIMGGVLIRVGVAREADTSPDAPEPKRKRIYRRKDLRAED